MTNTEREAGLRAIELGNEYERAYEYDSGFDAGEFSGPAIARAEDAALDELAASFGITRQALDDAVIEIEHENDCPHCGGLCERCALGDDPLAGLTQQQMAERAWEANTESRNR